jgi:hypothetical protein
MCQPCVKHVCFISEVPHLTHGSHMDEARFTHGIQIVYSLIKYLLIDQP